MSSNRLRGARREKLAANRPPPEAGRITARARSAEFRVRQRVSSEQAIVKGAVNTHKVSLVIVVVPRHARLTEFVVGLRTEVEDRSSHQNSVGAMADQLRGRAMRQGVVCARATVNEPAIRRNGDPHATRR